jgi:hypothetical protein
MNSNLDAGIPVLTEVIPVSDEESKPQEEPAVLAEPEATVPAHQPTLLEQAVVEWDEVKWDLLERELRERILYQIMERVDTVLEQRVRDSLADVLQTAVDGLASELKGGLQNTIKDVVTRTVAQEISNLQASKK